MTKLYQFIAKTAFKWTIIDFNTKEEIIDPYFINLCNPLKAHLLHQDVFKIIKKYDSDSNTDSDKLKETDQIILSKEYPNPMRENNIPGILYLNHHYGVYEKTNKSLYKIVPNDPLLPKFLIPYNVKYNINKNPRNKYAIFKFFNWPQNKSHPIGMLVETIGDQFSNDLNSDYTNYKRYLLHCNNLVFPGLNHRLSIPSTSSKIINPKPIKLQNEYVFTIDKENTVIYDDAFSIINDERNNQTIVNIYISNVPAILKEFNLFDKLSDCVSSIYLPYSVELESSNIFMLSKKVSEYCSLKENMKDENASPKDVLCLKVTIDNEFFQISNMSLSTKKIYINENLHYNNDDITAINTHEHYKKLLETTQKVLMHDLVKETTICHPKDVVEYWMITMNKYCGLLLANNSKGIFLKNKRNDNDNEVSILLMTTKENNVINKIRRFSYKNFSEYTMNVEEAIHQGLDTKYYAQITSPIRRLVDIINMIEILQIMKEYNIEEPFINKWKTELGIKKINEQMKMIKRVQRYTHLFYKCLKFALLQMDKLYDGYVFYNNLEEISKDFGYKYNIYIPELNIFSTIVSNTTFEQYSKIKCTLTFINDKKNIFDKIKFTPFI